MYNKDGNLRRCLYCGQLFAPFNGSASYCCFGHAQMAARGDVHEQKEPPAFIPNESFMSRPSFQGRTDASR